MAFTRRRDPLRGVTGELQRVLDAAAAPGLDAELVGQLAASAAFLSSSTTPERAVSWSLAKLIATPVAALVAVTSLTGGVALAAASGNLPAGAQGLASKVGAPAPAPASAGERGEAQRSATATANLGKTNRGRCTAVTMGSKATQGKALQAPPLVGKTGCAPKAKPGSQRSATATANLANKPAKPAKPVKAAKPAKPAKPAAPATAADPAGRPEGAGRSAGRSAHAPGQD